MRVIVIMAGGTGERFWPLSRVNHPKQLLTLTGQGQSLLQEAVERSMAIVPPENIYIATTQTLRQSIIDADLGISDENVIAEPSRRNTAGCLIYAAATILSRNRSLGPEQVTMGVLTSDHRIPETTPFVKTVEAAFQAAEEQNSLVTIGIQPVRPETAYGYIEIDPARKSLNENMAIPLYPVVSFREKPSVSVASQYISTGHYYWNSGMFFWRLSSFQNEFGRANPVLATTLEDLTDAMMANDYNRAERVFDAMPNISIDYALMEKAGRVDVIPGNFLWDDMGSWDALYRTFQLDNSGNVAYGEPVLVDCNNTIVYNAAGQRKIAVAAVGLDDMIVVVNDDAVLIIPKSQAQHVRKAVSALRESGATQL